MLDIDNLEECIRSIYNDYYLDVYRFLISFTGDRNDAEDLTQEVFIRVLNSLENYNTDTKLKTWIFSIAKHVAIDHYRKKNSPLFLRMLSLNNCHQMIRNQMNLWYKMN
ncbi:RNA polymerase sigma factor [Ornithinibacillus caprae]|uniref:RNA polymerase sigma factor n=1 Tax=Ornithinibacillus caprae TaxID=2678566 RepID=UPI0024834F51|nr:RNA polymerase sigma factor [Ornithinibacillus caprae]